MIRKTGPTYRRMSDHRLYVTKRETEHVFGSPIRVCPYLERNTKLEKEWEIVSARMFKAEFKPANFRYTKYDFG